MRIRKIPCVIVLPDAPEPEYPLEDGLYAAIRYKDSPIYPLIVTDMFPWEIVLIRIKDGDFVSVGHDLLPAETLIKYPDIKTIYLVSLGEEQLSELTATLAENDIQLVHEDATVH